MPPNDSLRLAIKTGLIRMMARRLDYAPTAEELPMTASVFHDDLVAHGLGDADAERVRLAFEEFGRKSGRWPRPAEIIAALPKREKVTASLEHKVTGVQAKRNLARIKALLRGKVVDLGK